MSDRDGMVKLVFDRSTRRLIGCHCIGERASELVHVGQAVIVLNGTVETFIEMVFNHPTLGETFKYAAYDALASSARPQPRRRIGDGHLSGGVVHQPRRCRARRWAVLLPRQSAGFLDGSPGA